MQSVSLRDSATVRATSIRCSELGAATGLDPFRSPVALWTEKVGLADNPPSGEAAHWGVLLEPVVRAELETRGWNLMPGPSVLLADDLPFLVGHPDGYAEVDGVRGILEIKTTSQWTRGWEDDGVPGHVLAQTHGYLALSSLDTVLVACLVAGQRLEIRIVRRDDTFLDLLLERVHDFLGYVERNEPPPPDGTTATDDILKRLYPRAHDGVAVELTPADLVTVGQLRAVKEARKETERQESELEQLLKLRLGDAEFGTHDGETVVRWQTIRQHRKAQEARDVEYRRFSL